MKKNKMLRIIVRTALIVFLIIILLLLIFPIYLKSDAIKNDYAFAESNDGNWKAYLIPDPLGMLSGYLIYQGEEDGVENVQISPNHIIRT